MPHITVIIKRQPHTATSAEPSEGDHILAEVSYEVPHEATDSDVGQAVKKIVKQVRDLGN